MTRLVARDFTADIFSIRICSQRCYCKLILISVLTEQASRAEYHPSFCHGPDVDVIIFKVKKGKIFPVLS
jgi:hypothetical protein